MTITNCTLELHSRKSWPIHSHTNHMSPMQQIIISHFISNSLSNVIIQQPHNLIKSNTMLMAVTKFSITMLSLRFGDALYAMHRFRPVAY